jgi:signal transduction histidine kinase
MRVFELMSNKRIRRILLLILLFFIIIVSLLSTLFFRYAKSNFEQSELMRLKGIANSASLSIDAELHKTLMNSNKFKDDIKSNSQNPIYQKIHEILKSYVDAHMLKTPIYTLVKSADGTHYEFGVTSHNFPYFRHAYKSFPPSLIEMYEVGGMLSPYHDEYGSWITGFNVLKDSKGEAVALVMVDDKLSSFEEKLSRQVVSSLLWAIGLFALMYFILSLILTQILYQENKDKTSLEESNILNEKMRSELLQANSKLIDLDKTRKEMITNISHDLRTPLSGTIGYLELLNDTPSLNENDRKYFIDIAHQQAIKLRDMISDLFELSKLESGAILLNSEPFMIQEIVSDVFAKYKETLNLKKAQILTEIEDTGLAYGDIRLIERLLQNLLDNAVRYVSENGIIKLSILDADKYIKVKICNQGEPIPEEMRDKIFDRYYKYGDKSGTGLGLAICKKICDLHHCKITLEVNNDINSFWFTIPKYRE